MNRPPALNRALQRRSGGSGGGQQAPDWSPNSEEFYWDWLVERKPEFSSVYADEGGGAAALIDGAARNLSQTPREQCELEGLMPETRPDFDGPGRAVLLVGLKSQPQLNGRRGRVLPLSGRGAPAGLPSMGRFAVRLEDGHELAVLPYNLVSCHKMGDLSAAVAAPPTGPPPPPATGPLAALVRADVLQGKVPPLMSRATLIKAGMPDAIMRCTSCGDAGQQGYVALKRTALPSATRLPPSAVRLECVDCLARAAQATDVAASAAAVTRFVDGRCSESMEAIMLLQGTAMQHWAGDSMGGSGKLY